MKWTVDTACCVLRSRGGVRWHPAISPRIDALFRLTENYCIIAQALLDWLEAMATSMAPPRADSLGICPTWIMKCWLWCPAGPGRWSGKRNTRSSGTLSSQPRDPHEPRQRKKRKKAGLLPVSIPHGWMTSIVVVLHWALKWINVVYDYNPYGHWV